MNNAATRNILRMVTPPSQLAVAVSDAREHLSVEVLDDDNLIATYILAAQQSLGLTIGRALVPTSYALDIYTGCAYGIILPMPPVKQVTAVKTRGTDGSLAAIDPSMYQVSITSEGRAVVSLSSPYIWTNYWWPATSASIEYTAGYDTVPASLRAAILLTVSTLYENRSSAASVQSYKVAGIERLVAPFIDPAV
jgi:uncharacterized phiE125 gp8 family phage protein